VARRKHKVLPLGGADACRGTAETTIAPHANLDEDDRAVELAHDEIDLTASRARPRATR
jgi:hypothetical protein